MLLWYLRSREGEGTAVVGVGRLQVAKYDEASHVLSVMRNKESHPA